jgi:hypothetical protein
MPEIGDKQGSGPPVAETCNSVGSLITDIADDTAVAPAA